MRSGWVREHGPEHPSQWATIEAIASKLGCTSEPLRRWVRQFHADGERDDCRIRVLGGHPMAMLVAMPVVGARQRNKEGGRRRSSFP